MLLLTCWNSTMIIKRFKIGAVATPYPIQLINYRPRAGVMTLSI